MTTLIIRILCLAVIFSLMKGYSDSFTCGFWTSVLMELFMFMTRKPATLATEKK